jgi:hypothetical protein
MFKVIHVDTFASDVLVSINQTDKQLYESIGAHHYPDMEGFKAVWKDWPLTSDARTVTHSSAGFIVIRFRNKITPKHAGLVAHEAWHATFSLLTDKGINPCYETEEVFAYVLHRIVDGIFGYYEK